MKVVDGDQMPSARVAELETLLREIAKWLSIQDSPPIGTNAILVEIERALA